jgi:aspartate/methionine/tyrosine aminotransferase
VHPNNPTGHGTKGEERRRLEEICERNGLALIVDEVFLDYPLNGKPLRSFAQGPHRVPTFVLSGLSKIAGLPQMKVGWIAAFGPEALCRSALGRLEVIADTFLSMNAPAQFALPSWLANREKTNQQILERVLANIRVIERYGLEQFDCEAGWSSVIPLPRVGVGADRLLSEGVVVHPGSFYGMPEPERIVVSLIVREDEFSTGIYTIAKTLD